MTDGMEKQRESRRRMQAWLPWALLLGVPLALAATAASGALTDAQMLSQGTTMRQPGVMSMAGLAVAGLLLAGPGIAGLLVLRSFTRFQEAGPTPKTNGSCLTALGVVVESALLGLGALVAGFFILAFVKQVTEGASQGVMLSVLSQVVIVDGRALALGFLGLVSCALLWGTTQVARPTVRGLRQLWGTEAKARMQGWPGVWVAVSVAASLTVSALLVAGTSVGVRRVVTMALQSEGIEESAPVAARAIPAAPRALPNAGQADVPAPASSSERNPATS